MIYRLRYCNKDGIEARVDIQKGSSTPVIEVEGTERPFILSYNNDKGNKSGMFLTSSADIEIYETADFNIDNLKTSNETELAVTYYINDVVKWTGFIIPDFFSIEVRSNPVIVMTASDRLGTLKSVTLSDLPSMVNIRELAVLCLNKTGLTLPLKTMADFSNNGTDNAFFSYYIDSQRIKDIKGRAISCYDILSSILTASNSKLLQRGGEWVIINKLQHEIGSGKLYSSLSTFTSYLENIYNFDEVSVGARRTITPVAGSVGIYHEHGGRKSHPVNYDYSLGLSGWNSVNGFVATIENRYITGFLGGTPFFDAERTVKQYLLNYNNWIDNTTNLNTAPYITTDAIPVNSTRADRVEVVVDISSIMAEKLSSNTAISFLRYAVILTNGVKTYTLTKAGIFEILDPENISGHSLLLRGGQQPPLLLASPAFSNSDSFKGLFEVGEDDNVNDYSASIRIYGSGDQYVTVNYAIIKFSDVSELPKGTMYKTEQGNVFTKAYDIETSIFGDYLLSGLDGYFYRYPNDDTSSIYKDVNTLSSPIWTTPMIPGETGELPLLHHSMRQARRMFSVAHDLLSAEIEVSNFDPLAIFVSCDKRYTVVSAQFDFFKSNLSVELEEVAFPESANVRDFIYSYFGDGESGIKSIGGISGGTGGGGSTGGGLTPEQIEILSFWKKDPDNPNTIFTEMNAYSKLELSAYGVGDSGGGGGSDYERLDTWADYDSSKAGWVLSAFLGNDLNTRVTAIDDRVTDLENSAGGGTVTSVGISVPTGLSVSNSPITSSGVIAIGLQTGYSIPTTAKQGQWDTAYSNSHTHANKTVLDGITSALVSNWNTAYNNRHTHANKAQLDLITQSNIDVLAKLSIVNGNLQIDGNAYSTGELSAYGIGSGDSSGGGVDLLQAWTDYDSAKDNWAVKAGLLVPFYNDTKSRLTSLEGGAALSLNVTGSGNAIASLTKSGTALTAVKGNFAELDINGKILSSQLPSYVDDVLEYVNLAAFPATGETGKIYIAQDTNKTYRWSGTAYTEISASLALGETSSTAYRGDRGKTAYDHSQLTGNPHGTTFAQIVSRPTTITGYGITDAYTKTEVNSALTSKLDKSVFDDLFEKVEVSTGVFAIKAKYSFYSTGEVSAYGIGSGGSSGGSYERLDAWVDYDSTKSGWVLSAFLGNDLNTRVIDLENGSALTVNTTGTGNAITSLTKSGTVITANKDLTFSLSGHTHTISDVTGLQTTLNNKLETSIFNTHNNDNVRHITGAERAKWDGVVTDFAGLEIGSRNYILHSLMMGGTNPTFGDDDRGRWYDVSQGVRDATLRGVFKENTQYTLWYERGDIDTGNIRFRIQYTDGTNSGNIFTNVPFITPKDKTVSYVNITYSTTGRLEIINPTFVEGNKPMKSWTPAPEDQVSDWLTTDVNSFSYIKNKPTLLSQFTDNIGVAAHIANKSNPHSVTKAQVGLGNVDNTADSAKNVLSATKLTTARTIAGVSFDGTANIAIPFANLSSKPTTLSGYGITDATKRAGVGGTANSILSRDTRSVDEIPNTDRAMGMWLDFKNSSTIGLTGMGQGLYAGLLTILPYVDSSGNSRAGGRIALSNGNLYVQKANATDYANWNKLAFITDNVASATKLQTARTIAGVSFDGTANIAIPFANLSSKPTTLGGYGITDAVTLNTAQTITGAKTFNANIGINIAPTIPKLTIGGAIRGNGESDTVNTGTWELIDANYILTSYAGWWGIRAGTNHSFNIDIGSPTTYNAFTILPNANVGFGTPSPSEKLHVVGNILATGTTTTTKVIFNAAGWSMEQVGSELQMKHNNVLKMRFTSTGSIVATEEITAFGSTT